MARFNLSLTQKDCIYLYDGTLAGFYTCVHEVVYEKEVPLFIWPEETKQQSFFFTKTIYTHLQKAQKVRESIKKQLGIQGKELVETVFFSCLEDKEKKMLDLILLGYQKGKNILKALDHPVVHPLYKAQRHLLGEVHSFEGFVRFEKVEDLLYSKIAPKNQVLPFLSRHFEDRYANEKWIIFDEAHQMALCYEKGRSQLVPVKYIEVTTSQEELNWQSLWKTFYQTLSIKERENKKGRMNHMPKRYWSNLVEVAEER